jgi:hypothetical protein
LTARRGASSPERVRRKTRRNHKQYSQLFLCSHNARIFLHRYFDSSKMRLSGLTRSGERMAEFPAINQRSLFASIVSSSASLVVFYRLSSISFGRMGSREVLRSNSRSLDESSSVHLRTSVHLGTGQIVRSHGSMNGLTCARWAVFGRPKCLTCPTCPQRMSQNLTCPQWTD